MSISIQEREPAPAQTPGRETCFHCHLPVQGHEDAPALVVHGQERHFCCPGCHAVCSAIVESGLDDYYRYRTDTPGQAGERAAVPDVLRNLDIYDRPEVQKGFVRHGGHWNEASLLLEDIRCPACLWLNERHLRRQAGILDVHIDTATQRMRVRWDPDAVRLSDILRAIADIGYIAHPYDATRSDHLAGARRRRSIERLIFAGLVGMMVMNFSLATYFMGQPDAAGELPLWVRIGRWTSLLVSATLLAYPAQDFWIGAWQDLRNRRLGMDIPIVLGLGAAFGGSLHATITGRGEVYFDSIAMFVFFILLARHWETRGRIRAADRLDRLARAIPQMARCHEDDGHWKEVAVLDLRHGDRVRVLPGETVPVDGPLLEGRSSFDESLLTGESDPVPHGPGDRVVAGSVNGDQPVTVQVDHAGEGTTIDNMRRLVDRGLEQRPRAALLSERAARAFVLAILVVAAATAAFWLWTDPGAWLSSTIAVLIVTCPCALALATPVALAVSAGRFVDLGMLPLRMSALEPLALADMAAFDKTGTLTTGRPELLAAEATGGLTIEAALRYASALAGLSEHPVARSLKRACPGSVLVPMAGENIPGSGISARIEGRSWRLGRPEWATAMKTGSAIQQCVDRHRRAGHSVSVLSRDGVAQAVLAFADTPRQGAEELIDDLGRLGIPRVALLSGDTQRSVSHLAGRLGITEAHSGMSPQEKLSWVRDRQAQGHRVLMVGDGINDAPTLAQADVSVSLSESTDLANASSDFLLMSSELAGVGDAIRLARRTRINILQNLLWASGYNLLAVPLAAAGFVPPWAAAIGMSASSLLVVLNALRLRSQPGPGAHSRAAA